MKLKKEDIKEMSTPDLVEKISEFKVSLTKMRFNHVITPLENPNLIKGLRRNIARLKTELKQRETQQAKG